VTPAFRAPEERVDAIPEFPFDPRYREVDGLRLCHLDEGEGEEIGRTIADWLASD
jgi:haloalkane dehalogenase